VDLTIIQGSNVRTGSDLEGRESAILTTIPNNNGSQMPPQSGSLSASGSGSSSPRNDRLSITTNTGADTGRENTEESHVVTHEQGTPGQPSAVPDPSMPTAQPVPFSSKSAPLSSSANAAKFTQAHALSTEVSGHYPTICANPPEL